MNATARKVETPTEERRVEIDEHGREVHIGTWPLGVTLVMGNGRWGSGKDLATAKAEFRRQGGVLGRGYMILTFNDDTEFLGVTRDGFYQWRGDQPAEQWVEPTARYRR